MNIILYTTHCSKCNILKNKLDKLNIKYTELDSVDEMISLGFTTSPILLVDGKAMDFISAIGWVREKEREGSTI